MNPETARVNAEVIELLAALAVADSDPVAVVAIAAVGLAKKQKTADTVTSVPVGPRTLEVLRDALHAELGTLTVRRTAAP